MKEADKQNNKYCEHSINTIRVAQRAEHNKNMDAMHEGCRMPCKMYCEGLTLQQIAKELNKPVVTVANRINMALTR